MIAAFSSQEEGATHAEKPLKNNTVSRLPETSSPSPSDAVAEEVPDNEMPSEQAGAPGLELSTENVPPFADFDDLPNPFKKEAEADGVTVSTTHSESGEIATTTERDDEKEPTANEKSQARDEVVEEETLDNAATSEETAKDDDSSSSAIPKSDDDGAAANSEAGNADLEANDDDAAALARKARRRRIVAEETARRKEQMRGAKSILKNRVEEKRKEEQVTAENARRKDQMRGAKSVLKNRIAQSKKEEQVTVETVEDGYQYGAPKSTVSFDPITMSSFDEENEEASDDDSSASEESLETYRNVDDISLREVLPSVDPNEIQEFLKDMQRKVCSAAEAVKRGMSEVEKAWRHEEGDSDDKTERTDKTTGSKSPQDILNDLKKSFHEWKEQKTASKDGGLVEQCQAVFIPKDNEAVKVSVVAGKTVDVPKKDLKLPQQHKEELLEKNCPAYEPYFNEEYPDRLNIAMTYPDEEASGIVTAYTVEPVDQDADDSCSEDSPLPASPPRTKGLKTSVDITCTSHAAQATPFVECAIHPKNSAVPTTPYTLVSAQDVPRNQASIDVQHDVSTKIEKKAEATSQDELKQKRVKVYETVVEPVEVPEPPTPSRKQKFDMDLTWNTTAPAFDASFSLYGGESLHDADLDIGCNATSFQEQLTDAATKASVAIKATLENPSKLLACDSCASPEAVQYN